MQDYTIDKIKLDKSNLESLVNLNLKFSREVFRINENFNRVKHNLKSNFEKRVYDCLVAKNKTRMVGYSLWGYEPKYHKTFKNAYLIEEYVLPNYRKKLIGLNLISLTLKYLQSKGCQQCFINVDHDNKKMMRLIKFFKFEPAYKRRNLFKKKLK